MLWGGRWEGGSCLGTHVRIKDFKIKKKKRNTIGSLMVLELLKKASTVLSAFSEQTK